MWWPFKKKEKVGSICGEILARDRNESHAFDVVPSLWGRRGYTLKREFVEVMANRAAVQVGIIHGVPISVLVYRNEGYTAMFGALTARFHCGDYMEKLSFADSVDLLDFETTSLHPLIRINEYVDLWVRENIDSMKSQQNMEKHVEVAASIERINNFAARGV